jgi:hypothetical protein
LNAIQAPSGDHFAANSPPGSEVSFAGAPPFDGEIQIAKLRLYASFVPSGEKVTAANIVGFAAFRKTRDPSVCEGDQSTPSVL